MADDETADVLLRTVSNLDLKWGRLSYSEQLQIIHWTILQSVNDMLARPWFKRTWVVQEVFRARKVGGPKFHGTPDAVIHIGGKAILWGAFASFINGFKNQIHISRLGRLKHIEPNDLTDWKLFLRTWQDLWNRYIQTGDTYDILQLMHKTTSFLATDPRDKFFAMMQLARNTREDERLHPLVRTNYNKTLSQVTRDFTEWHILRTRRVGVLNMLSLKKETEIGEPSWVPNILNPTDECPFLRLPSYIHDEYDGFLSSTKFSRDGIHPFQVRGRSLFARGMQICRVAHVVSKLVADPASRKIENPVKVIGEEWGLVNLALDILNRDKKPRLEPENFSSDLLKMVGCYGDEEAEAGFELHRRGHAMEINDQKLVDIYFDRASSWCHHRRLFLDDRGSMGLCPEGTEDGDIVVMLQSSFVPHVLRVLDDGPYGMLGPCLYYGGKWLQGEADDYQKMYNVQPEWFEIW
ncbi:hypothetical protein B0J11DRAFT_544118 [Dendryphion nanum]|uniref:Heterokaryon incompatibility domain-containing protein n=1 Tax=Dendryphion nanum TaxID=256645 RepID=A0A9P9I8W8_9PLEO|nr:hypothetical protein B0J11DRAFT_544118 [Dendryphion nanum]